MELMVCLFLAALAIVSQASAANAPAITVGRIYYYRRGSAPLCSRGEGLGDHGQRRTLRDRGYTLFRKPGDGGDDCPQRDLDQGREQHADPVHCPRLGPVRNGRGRRAWPGSITKAPKRSSKPPVPSGTSWPIPERSSTFTWVKTRSK